MCANGEGGDGGISSPFRGVLRRAFIPVGEGTVMRWVVSWRKERASAEKMGDEETKALHEWRKDWKESTYEG